MPVDDDETGVASPELEPRWQLAEEAAIAASTIAPIQLRAARAIAVAPL